MSTTSERSSSLLEFFRKYGVEIVVFSAYFLFLLTLRLITPIYSNMSVLKGLNAQEAFYDDWDFYYLMASDLGSIFRGEVIAPFCYRLLVPIIVGYLLPFDLVTNFALLSFTALFLTGILIYFTLRLRFTRFYSITGLLLFCSFDLTRSLFRYHFIHVHLVDPLAYFFIMCCFYAILTSNKKFYMISLLIGAFVKEVVLFTIPVFLIYVLLYEENENKTFNLKVFFSKDNIKTLLNNTLKSSIFIIPGILAYFLLRILITAPSVANFYNWNLLYRGEEYLSIENIRIMIESHIGFYFSKLNFLPPILTWGSFTLILFLFNKVKTIINWIKLFGIYILIVYFQLFLSYGERVSGLTLFTQLGSSRVTGIGFFPIILLAVFGLKNFFENYVKHGIEILQNNSQIHPFRLITSLKSVAIKYLPNNIMHFKQERSKLLIIKIKRWMIRIEKTRFYFL